MTEPTQADLIKWMTILQRQIDACDADQFDPKLTDLERKFSRDIARYTREAADRYRQRIQALAQQDQVMA
jgi:hypothetical protein